VRRWKLEDAKNQFSRLVREALSEGPQLVTRNGRETVVVVSAAEYEQLVAPRGLVQFLRDSPLADAMKYGDFELDRPTEPARDVEL
jgi:antitoxin Phd